MTIKACLFQKKVWLPFRNFYFWCGLLHWFVLFCFVFWHFRADKCFPLSQFWWLSKVIEKTIFWTRTICSEKTYIFKLASNQCRLQQTLALWSPPVAAGVAWFPAALAPKKGACSTQDVANGLSFAGLSNCSDLRLAVAQMSRIEMISSIKSYQKTHNMTKLHILVFDGIWTSHHIKNASTWNTLNLQRTIHGFWKDSETNPLPKWNSQAKSWQTKFVSKHQKSKSFLGLTVAWFRKRSVTCWNLVKRSHWCAECTDCTEVIYVCVAETPSRGHHQGQLQAEVSEDGRIMMQKTEDWVGWFCAWKWGDSPPNYGYFRGKIMIKHQNQNDPDTPVRWLGQLVWWGPDNWWRTQNFKDSKVKFPFCRSIGRNQKLKRQNPNVVRPKCAVGEGLRVWNGIYENQICAWPNWFILVSGEPKGFEGRLKGGQKTQPMHIFSISIQH